MRVFLDANVLFSASKSDGAVRSFLGLLVDRGHELWVDAFVIEEARRNLANKFPEAQAALEKLLETSHRAPVSARAVLPADIEVVLPEKDRPVLAAAIRAGCDVLVTGDKAHFGALFGRNISGVTVHSPAGLAASIFGPKPSAPKD